MARLALVGLPNVGKTTLFNAVTGLEAPTAPHPYSTREPHIGVAAVPDPRLERLAALEGSAEVVHATLELVDLPAGREGRLEDRLLGRLREADALAMVLRAFTEPAVPAEESGTDPAAQAGELSLHLVLADLDQLSRRLERVAKEATADPAKRAEEEVLRRAAALLEEEAPLRSRPWGEEARYFRDLAPLTLKPAVWVVNVGEEQEPVENLPVPEGDVVVSLSCRLEEEGARLEPEERAELFEGLGLGEGALARMVRAAYRALGLVSFYTVNRRQAHAWTVPRGTPVAEAAGKVHSDMERGFIRAEVAPADEVIGAGGWEEARRRGIARIEGRDYLVQEGDLVQVRFSV